MDRCTQAHASHHAFSVHFFLDLPLRLLYTQSARVLRYLYSFALICHRKCLFCRMMTSRANKSMNDISLLVKHIAEQDFSEEVFARTRKEIQFQLCAERAELLAFPVDQTYAMAELEQKFAGTQSILNRSSLCLWYPKNKVKMGSKIAPPPILKFAIMFRFRPNFWRFSETGWKWWKEVFSCQGLHVHDLGKVFCSQYGHFGHKKISIL